jgi:hypothetical protein
VIFSPTGIVPRSGRSAPAAPRIFVLVGALGALLAGCEPTCTQTCKKLLACEDVETPRVGQEDCEFQCSRQEELYDGWTDESLQQAFADQKRCVMDEECADIADGVCYDESLSAW